VLLTLSDGVQTSRTSF